MDTGELEDLGPVLGSGEGVPASSPEYQAICRCLGLDPRDGAVYWSDRRGDLHVLPPGSSAAYPVSSCNLARLITGRSVEPAAWGSAWRNLVWRRSEGAFYGMLGTVPPRLFRFEPAAGRLESVVDIGIAEGSKRPALAVPWVTLALGLSSEDDTLHYIGLDRGPVSSRGRRLTIARPITYDLPTGRQTAHEALVLRDGRVVTQCEAIEVHDGMVYAIGTWARPAHPTTRSSRGASPHRSAGVDLLRFPDPTSGQSAPEVIESPG
jgi:hypothetical protein